MILRTVSVASAVPSTMIDLQAIVNAWCDREGVVCNSIRWKSNVYILCNVYLWCLFLIIIEFLFSLIFTYSLKELQYIIDSSCSTTTISISNWHFEVNNPNVNISLRYTLQAISVSSVSKSHIHLMVINHEAKTIYTWTYNSLRPARGSDVNSCGQLLRVWVRVTIAQLTNTWFRFSVRLDSQFG